MDVTTIASAATILSLFVSILAIIVSLKTRQDYQTFKIKNQANIGTVTGNTVNLIMPNSKVTFSQTGEIVQLEAATSS